MANYSISIIRNTRCYNWSKQTRIFNFQINIAIFLFLHRQACQTVSQQASHTGTPAMQAHQPCRHASHAGTPVTQAGQPRRHASHAGTQASQPACLPAMQARLSHITDVIQKMFIKAQQEPLKVKNMKYVNGTYPPNCRFTA